MENISEGKMKWIKQLSLLLITLVLLTGSVQIFAASQSTEAKDDEVIKKVSHWLSLMLENYI